MNVNAITGLDPSVTTDAVENNASTSNTYFSNYINRASLSYGDYLEQIFQKASDTYSVSKDLLKAMAKAESNFRQYATSHCGAMGIMQLMPSTASSLGVTDAYDPEQNIMGGAQYISRLLEKYNGNLVYAVAAYNAGSGNVDKYGGIPPFKETQNYVVKVLQYMEEGVTIPESSAASAPGTSAPASTFHTNAVSASSGNALQNIMNKYFDYDDYLEFLQLFTKVIYEKLTGSELETAFVEKEKEDSKASSAEQTEEVQQEQQPVMRLSMKVKDSAGRVNTYKQEELADTEANRAFQYMTAGGQNRMSVFLTKTEQV